MFRFKTCDLSYTATNIALTEKSDTQISLPDIYGRTALHQAAVSGKADVIALMLARTDVDVFAKDVDGFTALHYACSDSIQDRIIEVEDRIAVVKLLLAHRESSALIRLTDDQGAKALDLVRNWSGPQATTSPQGELIQVLLDCMARHNVEDTLPL